MAPKIARSMAGKISSAVMSGFKLVSKDKGSISISVRAQVAGKYMNGLVKELNTSHVPLPVRQTGSDAIRHKLALQSTGIVTWEWDLETDKVTADESFYALFNLPHESVMTAQTILALVHGEDLPGLTAALDECLTVVGRDYSCRFRVRGQGGEWRWLQGKGQVSERDGNDKPLKVIGINYDVSEIVKTEDRLAAIAGEMRHRVKNSLAMVNALASATARESETMDQFVAHFRGRVDAIAAAQTIGAADNATADIECKSAVEGGLAPFLASADWARRIDIQCVYDAPLSMSLGQAITLSVYEFATNSVKYGALSECPGEITITISGCDNAVVVGWIETFGLDAQIDTDSTGFGSKLITRLVRAERGTINRVLSQDRLEIELVFPI